MKKKNIISLILSVIMLISTTSVFAKDYSDYPQKFWDLPKTHWAYNYISELTDKGVISGYNDGSYKPENTVSRAEWSKMMITAADLEINTKDYSISDLPKSHWAYDYVITAKDYMNWYSSGDNISFKPNQAASREDVTVSLVKLKGYSVKDVDYSSLSAFKDVDSISNDLKKYVAVALQKNLISGFEDNTFRGQDTLTRAEAATLLCRAFQMGNDNKIVDFNDFFNKDNNTIGTGISEIPKPIEKPVITPTPEPTIEPTPIPTVAPIPEPNPQPIEKPVANSHIHEMHSHHELETLTGAILPTTDFYTYDNFDNLYYLDSGIIWKTNMVANQTMTLCGTDPGDFKVPINGSVYTTKYIHQIFADKYEGIVYMYCDLKNMNSDEVLEREIVEIQGYDTGKAINYNKEKIKDDIGNNYHVSTFIGFTKNHHLLFTAKCNSGSYCHGMFTGRNYENGIILDPTYNQELQSFNGYRDSGYNDSLLTTFGEVNNNILFGTYNKVFKYNYSEFTRCFVEEPEFEFVSGFTNDEDGYYAISKRGELRRETNDGSTEYYNLNIDLTITDGTPLNFAGILPIAIVTSKQDIVVYDKQNNCFRKFKDYKNY